MRSPLSPFPWLASFVTAGLAGCGPVSLPTAERDQRAPAAAPEVVDYTLITTCGTIITQPGKYRLEKDVSCANAPRPPEEMLHWALLIRSDHVVVDLNGHHISGGPVDYGVWVTGSTDVTIRGPGFVSGFMWEGIFIENASHVTVTKIIDTGDVDFGLDIRGSSDVTIHDNVFTGHDVFNINAEGSSLRFLYNHIGSASGMPSLWGMSVSGTGNEIRGNVIDGAYTGLSLGGDRAAVTSNQIHAQTVALRLGGHGNWIVANRLSNDGWDQPPSDGDTPADIVDSSACGANIYKGNWFTKALPACVQVPRGAP